MLGTVRYGKSPNMLTAYNSLTMGLRYGKIQVCTVVSAAKNIDSLIIIITVFYFYALYEKAEDRYFIFEFLINYTDQKVFFIADTTKWLEM